MGKKKHSKAWKDLEKKVVTFLGGERPVRMYYGDSKPDGINCGDFIPECKYRKALPNYLRDYILEASKNMPEYRPVVVIESNQTLKRICYFWFNDLFDLRQSWASIILKQRTRLPWLAVEALEQAERYKTGKIAIAVLKSKNMFGEYAFMDFDEFCEYRRGSDKINEVD